jgi:hypothetical protein
MAESYTPNSLVRAGYHIPRLTEQLQAANDDFSNIKDDSTSYLISIITFPLIIIAAGILAIIIYQLALCFKWCCHCCCKGCQRKEVGPQPLHDGIYMNSITKNNPVTMSFFYILVVFALIANACIYKSNSYFSNSVTEASNSMTSLSDLFTSIADLGEDLVAVGNEMIAIIDSTQCAAIYTVADPDLEGDVSTFISYASEVNTTVGTFPTTIDSYNTEFTTYADKKDIVVYCYFAVITFIIFMLFFTACCKSKMYLNFTIIWVELIVLTLSIVAGLELIVTVSSSTISAIFIYLLCKRITFSLCL